MRVRRRLNVTGQTPARLAPRLSICIPTYNRAEFIGETLESIAREAHPDVEVVVSDNASSDNTSEVVESYRTRIPRLIYFRSDTNDGFAVNFFRAVDLSHGTYAWLLGSDDVVRPGMLARAVKELESRATLYVYDRLECDRHLAPLQIDPILSVPRDPLRFPVHDRASLLWYLGHSRSIASLFSFMSSVIFERGQWDAIAVKDEWMGCFFPHAMKMWAMQVQGGTLAYVDEPLVLARLENDTFNPSGKDIIPRLLMNYHGFEMIRNEFWSRDRALREGVNKVMRRTHPRRTLLKGRHIVGATEIDELCRCLEDFGYGRLFVRLYRTELSRRLVASAKRMSTMLRPSRAGARA
ncbi:MAG: glycosyltransferase [Gemmatimonadetes bacterium]|nr:glycosyltransferase [Gemmatimonadota bacterium]